MLVKGATDDSFGFIVNMLDKQRVSSDLKPNTNVITVLFGYVIAVANVFLLFILLLNQMKLFLIQNKSLIMNSRLFEITLAFPYNNGKFYLRNFHYIICDISNVGIAYDVVY